MNRNFCLESWESQIFYQQVEKLKTWSKISFFWRSLFTLKKFITWFLRIICFNFLKASKTFSSLEMRQIIDLWVATAWRVDVSDLRRLDEDFLRVLLNFHDVGWRRHRLSNVKLLLALLRLLWNLSLNAGRARSKIKKWKVIFEIDWRFVFWTYIRGVTDGTAIDDADDDEEVVEIGVCRALITLWCRAGPRKP